MSIVIINPNSTQSMTDAMLEAARRTAPDLSFEGWTSTKGPPSIQGREDGDAAAPPLLDLIAQARDARGIIIGCFDDTALDAAARAASCPVIGIGQACYHLAAMRQWRFSVVTTLAVSVPIIEENIRSYGLDENLARVRASDVPVLDLEAAPEASSQKIIASAKEAEAEDGIDALILGCAGMVHVTRALTQALSIRVLDPVTCAATCMAWLCSAERPT